MNRSYRAPEKEMPATAPATARNIRNSALREKEEELGLFLEMRKREKERNEINEFDSSLGSRTGNSPVYRQTTRKTGADEFLNSENDKNDYEWLLTPPGTPLFPSLETESQKPVMSQNGTSKAHLGLVKSRLSNPQAEGTGRNNLVSRPLAASTGSGAGHRRSSSSGGSVSGSGSRPSTPTGKGALGAQTRAISNTVTKPKPTSTTATTVRPTRSSTPTSRPSLSSSKPTVPARSSTPTRSTARSSTPTSRPSLSTTKPAPRAPTPPRRLPTLSTVAKATTPLVKSPSNASISANSPNARPRPWKPQEMPGYTLDAPPNLRTSLTDRPISSIRGRAGAPSSRSLSIEPAPNGRVRRQSCSPSRGRLPNAVTRKSGTSVPIPALNRAYAKANDNVSPGSYGTKMVERVINMRKLMPPKQDDKHSPSNLSGKSSSPDSSGFGRSISKKSLDMAMRHMDIRRTVPGNLRPLMTKIPASSMYSVRSGPTRSRMISVSDSPVATSSNASSEMSVNNNNNHIDENVDDESNSEKGVRSPGSIRGRHNALRIENKEKLEKELLNHIIDEAEEYKISFHNKRRTVCDNNIATKREGEKVYLAGRDKFHAEAEKSYWTAIADLIPKEAAVIETRGAKKDQDKKQSVVVIQGPKPGKPTDLSRMRQIIIKLKHDTSLHLKHSPPPPVSTSAPPPAEAVAVSVA